MPTPSLRATALMPDVRRHRYGHARDRSWAITTLNMVGAWLVIPRRAGVKTDA